MKKLSAVESVSPDRWKECGFDSRSGNESTGEVMGIALILAAHLLNRRLRLWPITIKGKVFVSIADKDKSLQLIRPRT